MKVIKFNTPDGQYTLPLVKVAEHRADYYSTKGQNNVDYQEEVELVMNDSFEGIDWLINNTGYEEWEEETTKLNDEVNVLLDDFWCSSDDFEIVTLSNDK